MKLWQKLLLRASLSLCSATAYAVHYVQPKVLPKSYNCRRIAPHTSYFSGGAPMPNQLVGSFGPAVFQPWMIKEGRADDRFVPRGVHFLSGFTNGSTQIVWSGRRSTFECNMGWSCFDKNDKSYLWEKGVIFKPNGKTMHYCHIVKLYKPDSKRYGLYHKVTFRMYETGWPAEDDHKYTCPGTLYDEVYRHKDFGLPVSYVRATDGMFEDGMERFPESTWNCKGVVTQNFGR